MAISSCFTIFSLLFLSSCFVVANSTPVAFLQCLYSSDNSMSSVVYTPTNSSYLSTLRSTIQNLRFAAPYLPRPIAIVTPEKESHIQEAILCSRKYGVQIRTRCGGHDYEGLSYIAKLPFIIIDLRNFNSIVVDTEKNTAWVQGGGLNGELYYRLAQKSGNLAFPAGLCPSVGVGGHFSGGGYGLLMRKYGLAADNMIDARLIDVNGRILTRESMGEDLFWAIRGGGGASFGVIVAYKINLVQVPDTVTVFTVNRTLEQNATNLIYRWQSIAHRLDRDLFIRFVVTRTNSSRDGRMTILASFQSLFLGKASRVLSLVQESLPELGLRRRDCIEMSWINAALYFSGLPSGATLEDMLSRSPSPMTYYKAKSDYVKKPIPQKVFEGLWELFYEEEAAEAQLIFVPYGGRMDDISESEIPFPHRAGNIYQIQHLVYWEREENVDSEKYINWLRRLYKYMAPYVSKSPREAYLNYRDLDLGVNNVEGSTSYAQAKKWGARYFKHNFDRLVKVKTMVDPGNFFQNEQSIPPLT